MTPNADGPDISHWQKLTGRPFDSDWRVVSIKCSEGERSGDSTFVERWSMLRDARIEYRGAYHWLRSDSSVKAQAENLCRRIDQMGGLQTGEFIQCDWETTPKIADVTVTQVEEWCRRVNEHFGAERVIVYASDWVPGFAVWRARNPQVPLWYANYNVGQTVTGGWSECARYHADVWQWTSKFQHPSIVGGFDMNHVFNWSALERLVGRAVTPTPDPIPPEDDDMAVFAKVDNADTAVLLVDATSARWLATSEDVAAAGEVATNTVDTAVILSPLQCRARIWLGQQPHYHQASKAGSVRCKAEMFAGG